MSETNAGKEKLPDVGTLLAVVGASGVGKDSLIAYAKQQLSGDSSVLFAIAASIALNRMVYGRSVLAIGQNIRAAKLAGVKVQRTSFITYALCGMLGGLDGALLAAYFRGANVDIGNEYLLASIAVVVIGGTSVAGGKANVPGVWGAALFLVLLLTMLNTFGFSVGVRLVLTGLIIVGVITAAGGPRLER